MAKGKGVTKQEGMTKEEAKNLLDRMTNQAKKKGKKK